jgi:hypothetical protein
MGLAQNLFFNFKRILLCLVGENVNATKSRRTSEKNDSEKTVIKKETNSFSPGYFNPFSFP